MAVDDTYRDVIGRNNKRPSQPPSPSVHLTRPYSNLHHRWRWRDQDGSTAMASPTPTLRGNSHEATTLNNPNHIVVSGDSYYPRIILIIIITKPCTPCWIRKRDLTFSRSCPQANWPAPSAKSPPSRISFFLSAAHTALTPVLGGMHFVMSLSLHGDDPPTFSGATFFIITDVLVSRAPPTHPFSITAAGTGLIRYGDVFCSST